MTPRRSNRPPLTRTRIVEAAMRILDREGLAGLAMRRLGQELAVDASTLYYHLPAKSALYDLVVDAVMAGIDLDGIDRTAPPAEQVLATLRAFRRALLAHPHALPLFAASPLTTPASLGPADLMLAVLAEAGLGPARALGAVNAMAHYVLGATITLANQAVPSAFQEPFDEARLAALAGERFPHVRAAVTSGEPRLSPEEEFEVAARALVHGLLAAPVRSEARRASDCRKQKGDSSR